jgi:ssDNA-binding Zn-finger/Zn-ribbon topoisomerase 1
MKPFDKCPVCGGELVVKASGKNLARWNSYGGAEGKC